MLNVQLPHDDRVDVKCVQLGCTDRSMTQATCF